MVNVKRWSNKGQLLVCEKNMVSQKSERIGRCSRRQYSVYTVCIGEEFLERNDKGNRFWRRSSIPSSEVEEEVQDLVNHHL